MSVTSPIEEIDQLGLSPQDIELQVRHKDSQGEERIEQRANIVNEESGLARADILRILAAGFSFFFAGTNDGSLGPLIPYILKTYHVGTQDIAIIYAASFAGWLFTAATNSHVFRYMDLGAILMVGCLLQLISHLLRFWTPPFALYAVTFFLQAAGMSFQDSHSNTFVASMKGAHRLLGFIHAMYALGCLVSPFVATAVASKAGNRWPLFYLFLVGLGSINTVGVLLTFRNTMKLRPKAEATQSEEISAGRSKNAARDIIDTLKAPAVWLLSLFYFFMLGVGITAGGWVVEYLVTARNGHLPDVGYVPSGLWGGVFLGRVLLAEPTHRLGERKMPMIYCFVILAMQLIFWLVPNLVSSAVAICILGVFYGPMFATGMSIASKLFPKHIQPTALGLIFVLAQAGGCLFPALTGVIASKAGVKIMQPILVGLIVLMGFAWALIPKVPRRDE